LNRCQSGYRMVCKLLSVGLAGVALPPCARRLRHPVGRWPESVQESRVRKFGSVLGCSALAAKAVRRSWRPRRNVVSADGVRLAEAPDAPSRGEVRTRFPSGRCRNWQCRVALGDLHPSRDSQSLHDPGSGPGRITHAAISRMRASTGMADSMTTGLVDQDGGDSGTRATASGKRPLLSEPASGKDPL
jgi:hypothetical protein